MKSQLPLNPFWHFFLGVSIICAVIASLVADVHAQTGSRIPILDHIQGQVLVDVYDNPTNNNLIADNIPLELYSKRVLPNEWYSTWHPQSLRSGAVAVRTYALYRVHRQKGDVQNCDCRVNIFDLTAIGGRYDMTSQDPGWDPHYNIAHQPEHSACRIDLFDLVRVSGHYDETCQF